MLKALLYIIYQEIQLTADKEHLGILPIEVIFI
jgi:hypothetical protein